MSASEPRFSGENVSLPMGMAPRLPLSESSIQASGTRGAPGPSVADKRRQKREPERDPLPPLVGLGDLVFDAPPWLFSAALHMFLVIVLGLLFISTQEREELVLRFDNYDLDAPDLSGSEIELPMDLAESQLDEALEPTMIPQLADPVAIAPSTDVKPVLSRTMPVTSEPIRAALSGRERGMQQALLDAFGGTGATQRAVMDALRWLARQQQRNGSWSLHGPYSNGSRSENLEAASAMALLAFQGAGYTPQGDRNDPFTEVVQDGWKNLLAQQSAEGNFWQSGQATSQLYTQALCSIAICELYGMTREPSYRDPAQRAINYCVSVQAPEGGWKYFPGTGSDLSVTGWFMMALQSGRMAGLEVPTPTLDRISEFLDSVSAEYGSRYCYQPNSRDTLSMTAEGLLCRQYLGWPQDDRRLLEGADYLVANLPEWNNRSRDAYYWYYATQVCHHLEGEHWRAWNNVMREVVPRHQVKEGKERGSWDPQGFQWETEGGRLFITCLNTYMLEVYYRHLPIYQLDMWAEK